MTLHACLAARPYINFLSLKFREVHPDHNGFERKTTKFMLLKTPKTIRDVLKICDKCFDYISFWLKNPTEKAKSKNKKVIKTL